MSNCMCLHLPDSRFCIRPGYKVRLGRFTHECWVVGYGWYTWGGNRPVCGWYLTNEESEEVKPLQKPDLDDIYIVES